MENHGVLTRSPLPQEWKAGGETGITQGSVADWKPYLPYGEIQNRKDKNNVIIFDTLACTHFASGHIYETFIIYLWKTNQLSNAAKEFFTKFLKDPSDVNSFRVSKQYSAIKGNNTKQGNYFTSAWDTWRIFGAIPDSMLNTLETATSWDEYHDKKHITNQMDSVAKESLKYVDVMYQWVLVKDIALHLSTSPLNVGIPIPAYHSVEQFSVTEMLNTYNPFIAPVGDKVDFAMQGVVKPRTETPSAPKHVFTAIMTIGARGEEVYWLQRVLAFEGYLNKNLINQDPKLAYFGSNTKNALKAFQTHYADFILTPANVKVGTGNFGIWSMRFINSKYGK